MNADCGFYVLDAAEYLLYTRLMSYHLYHTEGIILSSSLAGESNRFYHIYTKELGLIGVWGQGVRKLESKLRFHLQDFSHVRIHLVRGKNMWRLTDVGHIDRFSSALSTVEKRTLIGRMASLLKRLLDEESDPVLYEFLVASFLYLNNADHHKDELQSFELLFVLRVLHHLGYGDRSVPVHFSSLHSWNREVLTAVKDMQRSLTKIANSSLQQTNM